MTAIMSTSSTKVNLDRQKNSHYKFRQPLYKKVPAGGISATQLNRWDEKNDPDKFQAGLDKGLRSWAALRRSLASVATGGMILHETIPTRIKYLSNRTYYDHTIRVMTGAYFSMLPDVQTRSACDFDNLEKYESNVNGVDISSNTAGSNVEEQSVPVFPAISKTSGFGYHIVPPSVTILKPTFPAWSIADFKQFLCTGSASDILLTAYHHFHWRYLDMALAVGINIDTNVTGKNCKTLLFIAVENGDWERVEYLLEKGANPNVTDHMHNSPLHICMNYPIVFHPKKIATLLLNNGANVNAQNKRGSTPLHRAIILEFLDFVELFLKRRAKVFIFDNNNKLAFNYAGENEGAVAKLFNANVRFCGRRQHEMMWAYIMSRQFVAGIFNICASACAVCKRRTHDCAALKKQDFRYWLYVHEILAAKKPMK